MTLPSTPNLPVIFPSESVFLNYRGFQPFQAPYFEVDHPLASNIGAGLDHNKWRDQKIQSLMNARLNNKRRDQFMTGHLPSSITYTACNTSSRKLTGGVAVTAEGRKIIAERLQQRKAQLDVLGQASFSGPAPPGSSVLPPLTPEVTAPYDDAMTALSDAIQSGYYDRSVLENLAKANSALISVGAFLSDSQIAEYLRYLTSMTYSVESLIQSESGRPNVGSQAPKKLMEALLIGLRRQYKILDLLNKKLDEPVSVKQQLLNIEQGKKLPTEVETMLYKGPKRTSTKGEEEKEPKRYPGKSSAQDWLTLIREGREPESFTYPQDVPARNKKRDETAQRELL